TSASPEPLRRRTQRARQTPARRRARASMAASTHLRAKGHRGLRWMRAGCVNHGSRRFCEGGCHSPMSTCPSRAVLTSGLWGGVGRAVVNVHGTAAVVQAHVYVVSASAGGQRGEPGDDRQGPAYRVYDG